MPLYEYKCLSCGKVFEVIAKFSDPPLTTHAECGGEVERLASAPAFHLKGTGWYATDYAKKSMSPPAKSDDSKGDSKPAGDKAAGDKSSGEKPSGEKAKDSKPAASETKAENKPSSSDSKSDSK
jgi:putative FmdB family regulatory protein